MPDDLIHCPACHFQLRLPTELYGSAVECPQCHTRFTAPVPAVRPVAVRPPPGREYDANVPADDYVEAYRPPAGSAGAVVAPAIILLVLSGITLLFCLWGLANAAKGGDDLRKLAQDPNTPPQWVDFLEQVADTMTPTLVAVSNGVQGFLSLIIVLAAIQMFRLRTYWLALLGTILALNPINCPCCMLQLPVGVWALVVLLRPDVRSSFR